MAEVPEFSVVEAPRRIRFPPRVLISLLTLAVLLAVQGPSATPLALSEPEPQPRDAPAGSPASTGSADPPPMTTSPPPESEQVVLALFQPVHMVLVAPNLICPPPLTSASDQKTMSPPEVLRSAPVAETIKPIAFKVMRPEPVITVWSVLTLMLCP